jgi:hypothetical protein
MADEDTILEEAMDNLKEAGLRIRATQSLMRSQGMTVARTTATFSYAPFYGARHDRTGIPRDPGPERPGPLRERLRTLQSAYGDGPGSVGCLAGEWSVVLDDKGLT